MPRQRPTTGGLLPEAAHLILPEGIVSTGFPATDATCRRIGIVFDQWQSDLNRCILGKDADGLYAADTVVLSIPRQVGKTFDVGGVVFADSIINANATTVWTAHRFKVARESFNEMRSWAKSSRLRQHIDYDDITTAAGNECIPFRNGSRILFAARERGAIRGFTKVRRLILDEGQILTEHALADLVPTMNQAVNPQIILMGTPPKPTDPSEVWTRLRTEALSGDSEGVLYFEMSAPVESDLDDRDAWHKANWSFPLRTPEKAILRMKKLLSPDDFRREALGIWDDPSADYPIDPAAWALLEDPGSQLVGEVVFAFDVTPSRDFGAIAVAGRRADGLLHVEVVDVRAGTGWLVGRLDELMAKHGGYMPIVLDEASPAGSLLVELEAKGIPVQAMTSREVAQACGQFFDLVTDSKGLRHLGRPEMAAALLGAAKRPLGDAWAWARRMSTANISPLVAATLAVSGFLMYGEGLGPDDFTIM